MVNEYLGETFPVHAASRTYDFIAREFCVCDHWFCSVPGATMPNRCYDAVLQGPAWKKTLLVITYKRRCS